MDISDLIKEAKKHHDVDTKRIREAFEFAQKAHAGQTRMSGEPYITHPLAVAMTLAEYGADQDSIVAALLHDVVEDTAHTLLEIEKWFGKNIERMVDNLTKFPRVNIDHTVHTPQFDSKTESIRKIFETMEEDMRIIVIKLCDRLHNMQTLHHFRAEKQLRISQETFDIYAKIADRLCIYDLKEALEESSFKFIYPEVYDSLLQQRKLQGPAFEKNKTKILTKCNLKPSLKSALNILIERKTSFEYLIDSGFDKLEDYTMVSIIVSSETDCFLVLKDVHTIWKNIRGTFHDYITVPKSNGYRALETSIFEDDGTICKIVIQTPEMYRYSRFGVMTKCFSPNKEERKVHLPWIESLKRIHRATKKKSKEYLNALEADILRGVIIVYTLQNKIIMLPPKATALDAAFYHLGHDAYRLREVFINGRKASLSSPLLNGDSVAFHLHSEELFQHDWMYEVNTTYGRSFVSEKLKSFSSQKKHFIGKNILEDELLRLRKGFLDEISRNKKLRAAQLLGFKRWEDVLDALSENEIAPEDVLQHLFKENGGEGDAHRYRIQIIRDSSDHRSPARLFEMLHRFGLPFQHLGTHLIRSGYKDVFSLSCRPSDLRQFLQKIRAFYPNTTAEEYQPTRLIWLVFMLACIVIFWTVNPFFIKYLLMNGLEIVNTSAIKMFTAGVVLMLLGGYRKFALGEEFEFFQFSPLFWIVTLFLTFDVVMTHYSLYYVPSSHFISIMEMGHIYTFFFVAFYLFRKKPGSTFTIVTVATLLALTALGIILANSYGTPLFTGHLFSLGVLCCFFIHTFLNARFQSIQKVRNRALLQMTYMFLLGALFHLPFIQWDNLLQTPITLLGLAFFNGVFPGAIAYYFYLDLARYFPQYKINAGLSLILPIVVLLELFVFDMALGPYLLAFGLIFVGVLMSVTAERKSPTTEVREYPLSS